MHCTALANALGRLALGGAIDNDGQNRDHRHVGREPRAMLYAVLQNRYRRAFCAKTL
jgi:hypothetical protein